MLTLPICKPYLYHSSFYDYYILLGICFRNYCKPPFISIFFCMTSLCSLEVPHDSNGPLFFMRILVFCLFFGVVGFFCLMLHFVLWVWVNQIWKNILRILHHYKIQGNLILFLVFFIISLLYSNIHLLLDFDVIYRRVICSYYKSIFRFYVCVTSATAMECLKHKFPLAR